MVRSRLFFCGLAALAACTSAETRAPAAPSGQTAELGANLLGEPCRAQPRPGVPVDPNAPPPLEIVCAPATKPVAFVSASLLPLGLPEDGPERRSAVERAARATPAGSSLSQRMTCRPGAWTANELFVASCSLGEGSWPQIAAIRADSRFLLQAEGAPAALPAIERAFAQMTGGGRKPEPGASGPRLPFSSPEEELKSLEAAIGEQLPLFGSGDFDRWGEFVRLARLYNGAGNYAGAEAAWRRALDIQTRIMGSEAPGVGDTLMHLALEVSNQGRFDESSALFARADPLIQRGAGVGDRARLMSYLAFHAANQGSFADGLRYARAASGLRRGHAGQGSASIEAIAGGEATSGALRGELAHSLIVEAQMALRLEEFGAAEAAAGEALQIVTEVQDLPPWWRADALMAMGEVQARQGRLGPAERYLQGALTLRSRIFGDGAPTAQTHLALGQVYAAERLWSDAVRSYRRALSILERDEAAKAAVVPDQVTPFLQAAIAVAGENAEERGRLEAEIFRAAQLPRAGVADQTIARMSARLASDDPAIADLIRKFQEAQRRRDAARVELAHETALPPEQRGSLKENALAGEVARSAAEATRLSRELLQVFPRYAALAAPGPVELAHVQRLLSPDEALFVVLSGRRSAVGVVVRHDHLDVRSLDLDEASIDEFVRDLRSAFVVRRGGIDSFDLAGAARLHARLLAPFREALKDVKHLAAVTGGALASLPLGILVEEPPASQDYTRARWLARRMAVSQLPSVRAFVSLREAAARRVPAPKPLLAVANPLFEGQAQEAGKPSALASLAAECREGGPIAPALLKALAPLPETAGEVAAVDRLLGGGGEIVAGASASEAALRGRALDQYRILYFATHGLLPGELRCRSEPGLALSPPARQVADTAEDGLLESGEIAALKLNADLVVLSACNTASSGNRFGGEALSGLAEAFFHAGARGLVASHWQVPSAPTVRLMTELFSRVRPEVAGGTAEALRAAQLVLAADPATAHPFYWAAFALVGDGGIPARAVASR